MLPANESRELELDVSMSSQQKVTSWSSWAPLLPSRSQMTVISTLYRTDLRCILFSIQVPSNISVYAVTSKHRKITCRTHVDMGQEDAVHHLSYFITMVKVQWTTASYKRTPGGMSLKACRTPRSPITSSANGTN